jgi:hypothetical protein
MPAWSDVHGVYQRFGRAPAGSGGLKRCSDLLDRGCKVGGTAELLATPLGRAEKVVQLLSEGAGCAE